MSSTAQLKARFRQSKAWKDFRKLIMNLYDNKDPISGHKLYKGFNLHHRVLTNDMDVYRDLSNTDMFKPLNKSTHDAVHWGLDLIKHNGIEAFNNYYQEVLAEAVLNKYIQGDQKDEE